jgi:hypothetical protein
MSFATCSTVGDHGRDTVHAVRRVGPGEFHPEPLNDPRTPLEQADPAHRLACRINCQMLGTLRPIRSSLLNTPVRNKKASRMGNERATPA